MGKWIYYVEDDTSIRELVLYALKTAEFQVMGFENAASFYKRMKEQQPATPFFKICFQNTEYH